MIGRSVRQDTHTGMLDALGKFGAGTAYRPAVAIPARLDPNEGVACRGDGLRGGRWRTLQAANKPSEHNVQNVLPRFVVYQSPVMTSSLQSRRLISVRPSLRPGNQNLGGT